MKRSFIKALPLGVMCTLMCNNLTAQEADFDLSLQRSEIQSVSKVPGEKRTNVDWVINPVPHKVTLDSGNLLDISNGVALKGRYEAFVKDLDFISVNKNGVNLSIGFGEKEAIKKGVKALSGAYVVRIDKKGISIIGYDERGAFYGIQTLRQLLQNPMAKNGLLPYGEIYDYPDLPNRGVVEGFYGTP